MTMGSDDDLVRELEEVERAMAANGVCPLSAAPEPVERFRDMPPLMLVALLAGWAGLWAGVSYVLNSAADGLGLAFALMVAFFGFACTMALGLMALMLGTVIFVFLLIPLRDDDIKERIYLGARWLVFIVGLSGIGYYGVLLSANGWIHNRFVSADHLYNRCMTPQTRIVESAFRQCADGWGSQSIGRRGACSHHGGVVERWVTREETYQPHTKAFCRREALARSWID